MEASSDKGPRDLGIQSKFAVALKPFPDEYAQRHIKTEWWDSMMVRISQVPGLTEISHGQEPAPVKAYVLTSLDDFGDCGTIYRTDFRPDGSLQNVWNGARQRRQETTSASRRRRRAGRKMVRWVPPFGL